MAQKYKSSIYLPDRLRAVMGPVGKAARDVVSLSGRITGIADRYGEILARVRIQERFSDAEWSLLRDMLRGVWHEPAATIRGVHVDVEDGIRLDGLADKRGVDGDVLVDRLRQLSYTEEVALVEAVEQWRLAQPR